MWICCSTARQAPPAGACTSSTLSNRSRCPSSLSFLFSTDHRVATLLCMDDSQGFVKLVDGLLHYTAGDHDAAAASWSDAAACGPLPALFAVTLRANLGETAGHANPYEAHGEEVHYRQIDLFEQILQLEFVHVAQQLVINAQSAAPPGSTLLELGIGGGDPTAALVAASGGRIARVIAVDIDPANVEASRELIGDLDVEFVGVTSDFADLDWDQLRSLCAGTPVIVNAAFALHHLDLGAKTKIFTEVAALEPHCVTLVESSSSHASADMLDRLIGCYAHYSAVWSAIQASSIRRDARRGVLRFLGREISDIMRDDPVRYQRNEHWVFWYRMLLRSGLRPVAFAASQLDPEVVQLLPGAANVHARNTHLITTFSFSARRS